VVAIAPPSLAGLSTQPRPVAFNERSEQRLSGVNPALVELMRRVEQQALARGIEVEVSEGLRDRERQAELVAQGASQTMNSRHLHGNAVDLHILNPDGSINWDFEAYRPLAEIARREAAALGIPDFVWGGDWESLRDGVHFQIGGNAGGGAPSGGTAAPPASGRAPSAPPSAPAAYPPMPPAYPQNALAPQIVIAPPQMRNSLSVEPFLTQRRQNYLAPIPGSPFGA